MKDTILKKLSAMINSTFEFVDYNPDINGLEYTDINIDIIIDEYYIGTEKVKVFFQGTQDEYTELETVCLDKKVKDKIIVTRTSEILENARFIFKDIKEVFEKVRPIIENIVRDDVNVKKNLNKVSDALNDIIPICVFGNYSAGKSTFINALIGYKSLSL